MTRILLHIGTPKTGTTSLQRLLNAIEAPLRERGILYPQAARDAELHLAHHRLVWSITGRFGYSGDAGWRDLQAELDDVRPKLAIVSCEDFALFDDGQVARVADYLRGRQVEVVVYLRNQLDFLVSQYKQAVKSHNWKYRHSFRRYVTEHLGDCDYAALLDRWSNAFGAEAVEFRLYDKIRNVSRLEYEFLRGLGAEDLLQGAEGASLQSANVSPSDEVTFALRMLNRAERLLPGVGTKAKICNAARKRLMQGDSFPSRASALVARVAAPRLSTPADVEFLREATRGSNERFHSRIADPADREWFRF